MATVTHRLSSTSSPLFHHSHPHTLFQHKRSFSIPARRNKQASLIQCYGLCFAHKDHHFRRSFLVASCPSSCDCRTAVQKGRFLLHTGRNSHVKFQVSRSRIIAQALPSAGSAAIAIVIVGAAVVVLSRLKKDGTQGFQLQKKECEICKGSGICSSCSGEGFLLKNLSPEAAAKARAGAKDAATRYTAGLPNKWRYCTACSGSRNCLACEGRGWLD
ncbi:hypothetical protein O6H91_12G079100 [Diphasiastrum complanatum]|uniref:Uncharacterized protein n=1 Tax=Diphasiastrum complanatum TaxID=34168 RepID=A0ACC2C404_DIPCM|nr:hypothetical protein O6H91_12G079100 [Diphasiastrum complanatum]